MTQLVGIGLLIVIVIVYVVALLMFGQTWKRLFRD